MLRDTKFAGHTMAINENTGTESLLGSVEAMGQSELEDRGTRHLAVTVC